jgi:glycosyltransferase involved in cell wall biosynthesis
MPGGRLRVGLNLVPYSEQGGGIARYVDELLPALLDVAPEVELHGFIARAAGARLLEQPWADRVRWTRLPVSLSGPPVHLAAQYGAIPALARARGLDVLHSPANAGPVRVPGLACVITVHDLTWLHAGEDWGTSAAVGAMRRWSPATARRADGVIVDSEATARDVVANAGVERRRLAVVPLGVRGPGVAPTSARDLRSRLGLGDSRLILSVCQKRPYKGLAELVRALPDLDGNVALVMPGAPTPHEAELRALAESLGVADRVHLPAWLPGEDLEGLYALADCFALASRYEGFGLPVLEAMARGVPVACSDRGALPEVAGDAALLFDPDDQPSLTAALRRLLSDRELAGRLVARGRERAASFTWDRTAELTLTAYECALSERRGRRGALR